jgi:hypothetical protein
MKWHDVKTAVLVVDQLLRQSIHSQLKTVTISKSCEEDDFLHGFILEIRGSRNNHLMPAASHTMASYNITILAT